MPQLCLLKTKERFNKGRKGRKGTKRRMKCKRKVPHLIEIAPRQEVFMVFLGFTPILWLGGHFFQMPPRDVARGALAKAGSCLCRAPGFSTIHCTKSLFTNRDASVLGMGRERNIPNVFYKISWFFLFLRVLCATLIIMIICWLIFDTAKQGSRQLISFGGLVMYVLLMLIFSKYPTRVSIHSMVDLWEFFFSVSKKAVSRP